MKQILKLLVTLSVLISIFSISSVTKAIDPTSSTTPITPTTSPAPVRSPIEAPPPVCIETQFYKIILNNVVEFHLDGTKTVKISYYDFVNRYLINGQFYTIIGSGNWIVNDGSLKVVDDSTRGLYVLKFKSNVTGYNICITAKFYEEVDTTFDLEIEWRDRLKSFQMQFPTQPVPAYSTKP